MSASRIVGGAGGATYGRPRTAASARSAMLRAANSSLSVALLRHSRMTSVRVTAS
jgi:hypothetical protein